MMKVNDEEIMDRGEVWSVKETSTDGAENEIAFPEGEADARRWQKMYGGKLWKRQMYVTAGEEVAEESDENLLDLV